MRIRIALAMASLAVPAVTYASGPPSYPSLRELEKAESDAILLSLDEATLSDLNFAQLRFLRRATRLCATPGLPLKPERNPCVIIHTDKAVDESGSPPLRAFHAQLPFYDRYDEYRLNWRRYLLPPYLY